MSSWVPAYDVSVLWKEKLSMLLGRVWYRLVLFLRVLLLFFVS